MWEQKLLEEFKVKQENISNHTSSRLKQASYVKTARQIQFKCLTNLQNSYRMEIEGNHLLAVSTVAYVTASTEVLQDFSLLLQPTPFLP